ncbi:hypothetical protein M1N16_05175 [Nitrospinaceae bacterium]|nr:hypothetical protein [Nitrospinaceae bacterium]
MVVAAPLYYSSGSKAKILEGSETKAIEQMMRTDQISGSTTESTNPL